MVEKPRVVITSSRSRQATAPKDFNFAAGLVPTDAIGRYRQDAWRIQETLPVPTVSEEAWRRTDLHLLPVDSFHLASSGDTACLPPLPAELTRSLVADAHAGKVLLTPGSPATVALDAELARQGVVFTDLRIASRDHSYLLQELAGKVVAPSEGKFAALSGALAQDGVLLYVPKNVTIELPLLSILWGPGAGLAHFSHLLVWVDEGASVTYMHEAASSDEDSPTLHAGIVEILVGEGAELNFVELQSWGHQVWNFSHERAHLGRDAHLDWIFGAVGSHLTKNFSELVLAGEGAQGRMSGFYFADGEQHLDHDTQQNHLAPHTTSDLLFKGALKGHSRSVWQGMIYVAPGAQKTDGYQANRNLVLSPEARADSIPGLEILADDVRCSHGATVGRLDAEPLFYLKSRGIPDREAEQLMVEGFFDPIMQRIPFDGVRSRFQQSIHRKMQKIDSN